jgi:hypothetical protein
MRTLLVIAAIALLLYALPAGSLASGLALLRAYPLSATCLLVAALQFAWWRHKRSRIGKTRSTRNSPLRIPRIHR